MRRRPRLAGARRVARRQRLAPQRPLADPLAPKVPHHRAKAKRVIFLFMAGAPSHLELFDNKPAAGQVQRHAAARRAARRLSRRVHQSEFEAARPEVQVRQIRQVRRGTVANCCRTSPTVVDDIAIVKSMATDAFNHAPAQIFMNTGSQQFGRPSFGAGSRMAWAANRKDLPGFVVSQSGKKGPSGGNSNWGSGFLPTVYQGVLFRSSGDPVLYLVEPARHRCRRCSAIRSMRSRSSTAAARMRSAIRKSPRASTRSRWLTACRSSAPEIMDIAQGVEADAGDVRGRAGQAVVRQQLPARSPAGRTRRALRATLPRSVGPARQPRRPT